MMRKKPKYNARYEGHETGRVFRIECIGKG